MERTVGKEGDFVSDQQGYGYVLFGEYAKREMNGGKDR
jgi:hypothetical protein